MTSPLSPLDEDLNIHFWVFLSFWKLQILASCGVSSLSLDRHRDLCSKIKLCPFYLWEHSYRWKHIFLTKVKVSYAFLWLLQCFRNTRVIDLVRRWRIGMWRSAVLSLTLIPFKHWACFEWKNTKETSNLLYLQVNECLRLAYEVIMVSFWCLQTLHVVFSFSQAVSSQSHKYFLSFPKRLFTCFPLIAPPFFLLSRLKHPK